MATRNLIMVVDRKHSSKYPEGFAIHPDLVNDKSYVNMYMHHDGYPEWQGVQIANWLLAKNNGCMDGARLASKLVHDMYYDSCYLYNSADRIDHEYRYVIWSGDKDKIHVSCWNMYSSKCVFVLTPEKIISKYMDDMEYEFNHALEQWWQDVYEELWDEAKDELLDSGDYVEEKSD